MLRAVLVVGANAGSDDEGSLSGGDDEGDDREYTAEEMARVRQILINKSRAAAIKKAQDFVSCGQGEGMCMFNTSDGNMICEGIPRECKKAMSKKTLPESFDALFALTHGLKEYDFWMNDNECYEPGEELEKSMKVLGKAWRDLLKNPDAALGIDTEFTRPGIEALLGQLETDFEECEVTSEFEFKWR